jgi:hypothetical protein
MSHTRHSHTKSMAIGWTTNQSWFDSWHGQEIFLFCKTYRLALGPTQPSIQWVSGGKAEKAWGWTPHLHLVPRFRMSGAIPSLWHTYLQWLYMDNFTSTNEKFPECFIEYYVLCVLTFSPHDVWAAALSWWRTQLFSHYSGRLRLMLSRSRFKTSRWQFDQGGTNSLWTMPWM